MKVFGMFARMNVCCAIVEAETSEQAFESFRTSSCNRMGWYPKTWRVREVDLSKPVCVEEIGGKPVSSMNAREVTS